MPFEAVSPWVRRMLAAAYNRVYNSTARGCLVMLVAMVAGLGVVLAISF